MLGIYIAALILGGGLLLVSIAGGHDGGDSGTDHDHAFGHGDAAHGDAAHDGVAQDGTDVIALFLSLRFWTFLLAFGGLTGVLLALVGVPEPVRAAVSGGVGFALGTFAAWAMQRLSKSSLSSALSSDDWIGRTARVTVPVSAARPGKIRVELDGEVVELIARATEPDGDIGFGAEVLVVAMQDGVASVTHAGPGTQESGAARRAPAALKT